MKLREIAESLLTQKMRDAIAWTRPYASEQSIIEPSTGNAENKPARYKSFSPRRGRHGRSLELRPGTIRL